MKRRDLEKKSRFFGWRIVRHGSRHDVWSDGEREIVAKAILKEAGGG
jgi:hypothetical protein